MKFRFSLLLVLVKFCLSLQLRAHVHEAATSKRFAYVTMAFDKSLLTPEEARTIVQSQDHKFLSTFMLGHPELQEAWDHSLKRDSSERQQQLEHLDMLESDEKEDSKVASQAKKRENAFDKAVWRAAELRKQGSSLPLVVMTNVPEDAINRTTISRFNIIPVKMSNFFTNRTCMAAQQYAEALQKVLVFGLTDYDKLMWLDLDTQVRGNPDRHFQTELDGGILGLRSDMWCDFTPNFKQPRLVKHKHECCRDHESWFRKRAWHDMATSVFLFEPSMADLQRMTDIANEVPFCITDQNLIVDNFWRKGPEKVMFLPAEAAMWARCSTQGIETDIVHKPSALSWQGGGGVGSRSRAGYPKGWVDPAKLVKDW